MSSYPALKKLGIRNPTEIDRHFLHSDDINGKDILRIVYKRKKGSLLPNSRKYKFGRSENVMVRDSGQHTLGRIHEISPYLSRVMDELYSIEKQGRERVDTQEILADEIKRLEEEVTTRTAYIQSLLASME